MIQKTLEQSLDFLDQKYKNFSWDDKKAYGDYLSQTYHYVKHSTRLLALAASRLGVDQEKNYRRFVEHMREENGHHVLAIRDLKGLDLSLEDFTERESTRAFYESQYYKIEFQDPLALMGYILLLEALAVRIGPSVHGKLKTKFGSAACSFFKVHSEEDPDHVKSAEIVIESLTPKQLEYVDQNIKQTTAILALILDQIMVQNGYEANPRKTA